MTQHTPGPWKVHAVDPYAKPANRRWLINPDVAVCKTEANAEFIVRACNSHDDLLEACQLAARILARDGFRELRGLAFTDDEPERIATAIAKATGAETAPELLEACELAARFLARDGIHIQPGLAYTGWRSGLIAAAIARATEPETAPIRG